MLDCAGHCWGIPRSFDITFLASAISWGNTDDGGVISVWIDPWSETSLSTGDTAQGPCSRSFGISTGEGPLQAEEWFLALVERVEVGLLLFFAFWSYCAG